jgi:hypothetical protein
MKLSIALASALTFGTAFGSYLQSCEDCMFVSTTMWQCECERSSPGVLKTWYDLNDCLTNINGFIKVGG